MKDYVNEYIEAMADELVKRFGMRITTEILKATRLETKKRMEEKMMTLKELKGMKPDTIFASGIGLIEHPWFNDAKPVAKGGTLEQDGRSTKVKWIAIRGYIEDWAIYHSMDANLTQADYFDNPEHLSASNESIARGGAKLHDEEIIKKFVPCDDEAFKMYRH